MRNKLIPFYTYNEKDRLNYSLFLDITSMNVYRQYSSTNSNLLQSSKYWFFFYSLLWMTNQFSNFSFSFNKRSTILAFIIVGIIAFWSGYVFLYNNGMKKAHLKDVFLTKDEFIFYVNKGKRNCVLIVLVLTITLFGLFITAILFFMIRSLLVLLFCAFFFFITGIFMRSIPLRRIKLHVNESHLQWIALKVQERL